MDRDHALNQMVTTATALVKLSPTWDDDITPCREYVRWAATQLLALNIFECSKSSSSDTKFKNCVIVKLNIDSDRATDEKKNKKRSVAVKIFDNLSLHVTGCYCMSMIFDVTNKVSAALSQLLNVELEAESTKLTMVNYSYQLPLKLGSWGRGLGSFQKNKKNTKTRKPQAET